MECPKQVPRPNEEGSYGRLKKKISGHLVNSHDAFRLPGEQDLPPIFL